jgi:hypothetical protein
MEHMPVPRAKTVEEYVDLVDQALFEIEELRMAAEYDMDSMGASLKFVDKLERQVRELRASMGDGSYHFADRDLPFMDLVEDTSDDHLPFKYLLRMINETHRKGLDVGDG